MSKKDNTVKTDKNQYHHLKKEDRIKIEFMINEKDENGKRLYSNTDIAKKIGVHKSTISRELKRIKSKISVITGKIKNLPYSAYRAQNDYEFKRGLSKANYILDKYPKMRKYIEDKILNEKWAPDVIVGVMNKEKKYLEDGFTSISVPTIYNAIRYGIIKVKITDMRRMTKFEKHTKDVQKKEVPENKRKYSIERRPESINNRLEFGHFELDTVIGSSKGIHSCLLTMTERKTRFEIALKIESKSSEAVVKKVEQLKVYLRKNFSKIIKSLTTDNGSEFSDFLGIISNTDTKIYFCHPYASCEKGTNERHNGILRYFIPKGTNIDDYSYEYINSSVNWMNNYPRKILDYKTPIEALKEEIKDDKILKKILNIQKMVNA